MISKVLILIAALAAPSLGQTRLEILMSARDLPNADICCVPPVYPPDPYAVVFYAPSAFDNYVEQGRTQALGDNNNPAWSEIFTFNVSFGESPRIKIDVMDSDLDSDDYLGFGEFTYVELVNAFGNIVEKPLKPSGAGYITVQARINGSLVSNEKVNEMFNHPSRIIEMPVARPTITEIKSGKFARV